MFTAGADAAPRGLIEFEAADTIRVGFNDGTSFYLASTTAVFRDPSSWYHIVVAFDLTNGTNANRVKLYVNNVLQSFASTPTWPTSAQVFNNTVVHRIGCYYGATPVNFFDGYMAEVNFIDGQALTPSSFGSTNSTTGVWQPAKYTGTYGTNGFYLPFTNITSTTTLGYDSSGNGNNWTPNNISLTAGATYDSMTDVPTLTSATAANFAVMNPLDTNNGGSNVTLKNGNLNITNTGATAWDTKRGTMAFPATGKFYWEMSVVSVTGLASGIEVGIIDNQTPTTNENIDGATYGYEYRSSGTSGNNGSQPAYGASYTNGDVIGIACDATNGTITFYKNNTSQGVAYSSIPYSTVSLFPAVSIYSGYGIEVNINFGQQPFTYTPPSGFVALNTYNLPASTVPNGAAYMAATTYTGTLLSNTIANTVGSASFQPDWVWIKSRSAATDNKLTDSVRGVTKGLVSNTTAAETTDTQGLTAFGSTGFTVGTNTDYNNLSATYVAWQWKGGGTAVSNTSGTITSSVSANTTSGCSVVGYTGANTASTVGHGLGVAPSMIIVKARNSVEIWCVYHTSTGAGNYLALQSTGASAANTAVWNNTAPTSSVFSVANSSATGTVQAYVAYCFSAIKGFSAFGSYVANGSSDGPFVYTGFRPRFVMLKDITTSGNGAWVIFDTTRNPSNVQGLQWLFADNSGAESTANSFGYFDILSNGFKCRGSGGNINYSGDTYIYAAFAESPFQNSLAR
jgi:hypothetical protein